MFTQLTIVAPGLLGASVAMAAKKYKLAQRVSVYARRQEVVDTLAGYDWCDSASTSLEQACAGSDLIVLCSPVERIISLAKTLAESLSLNPIVSDVGSVKGDIVRKCEAALAGKARFVGSHPMAGSEKTGMENASADLFQRRSCFVTPSEKTDKDATIRVVEFWKGLGSFVIEETPDTHDEIVAKVSHLPHVLSAALASLLSKDCPNASKVCGKGLKDTTRIASGDPALWREIISQNRNEIARSLDAYQDHLQEYKAAIANQDDFKLLELLSQGKQFRDQL